MISAADRFVAGREPLLLPRIGDHPALAQELRTLVRPNPGIEGARAGRHAARKSEKCAGTSAASSRKSAFMLVCKSGVRSNRPEIERPAGVRSAGRFRAALLPVGADQTSGEMPAGGMAANDDRSAMATAEEGRGFA